MEIVIFKLVLLKFLFVDHFRHQLLQSLLEVLEAIEQN